MVTFLCRSLDGVQIRWTSTFRASDGRVAHMALIAKESQMDFRDVVTPLLFFLNKAAGMLGRKLQGEREIYGAEINMRILPLCSRLDLDTEPRFYFLSHCRCSHPPAESDQAPRCSPSQTHTHTVKSSRERDY